MSVLAAAVDGGALLDVVWVSLLAGVGVVMIHSVTILGVARASDARRDGRRGRAAAYGALALAAFLLFAAVIIVGVAILVS
jgi:hypothetical protein